MIYLLSDAVHVKQFGLFVNKCQLNDKILLYIESVSAI